jgi:hypothetical protein
VQATSGAGESRQLTGEQTDALNDFPASSAAESPHSLPPTSYSLLTINCLPSELTAVVAKLSTHPGAQLRADCAVGTIHLALDQADPTAVDSELKAITSLYTCVWTRLNAGDTKTHSVPLSGIGKDDRQLQKALKAALDPKDTFSPGRFPGVY